MVAGVLGAHSVLCIIPQCWGPNLAVAGVGRRTDQHQLPESGHLGKPKDGRALRREPPQLPLILPTWGFWGDLSTIIASSGRSYRGTPHRPVQLKRGRRRNTTVSSWAIPGSAMFHVNRGDPPCSLHDVDQGIHSIHSVAAPFPWICMYKVSLGAASLGHHAYNTARMVTWWGVRTTNVSPLHTTLLIAVPTSFHTERLIILRHNARGRRPESRRLHRQAPPSLDRGQ